MQKLSEVKNWQEMINQVIQGDCLEGIKMIPDKSVDLVITDPPYCIGTTSNGQKGTWEDNNLIRPFFEILFSQIKRVLKDNGEFYINTDWRTYPFLFPILTNKMFIRNCLVWDYEWIKAGSHYRFSHEFIIYGTKAESHKRNFSADQRDVFRVKPINFTDKNKFHNAQKPLDLIEKCILNSSKEGALVLDCFMGSFSTAVACKEVNRNFIGFELNEEYCRIGEERLKQAVLF